MNIIFENYKISDSPLSVLRHLYYYTKQYGLSVKQFTGQHWKYWEKLPNRIENLLGNKNKLSAIINELRELAIESETRQQRRRAQMQNGWSEKEVVINAQLISLLCALPPQVISAGVANLINKKSEPNYRVVKLVIPKEKGVGKHDYDFVEPDLLLLGNNHLVMIEIKTRGSSSSSGYSYPARQLFNYLRLAYECLRHGGELPISFSHIILVPTVSTEWFYHADTWIKKLQNGENKEMVVDFDEAFKLSKYSKDTYFYNFKKILRETPLYVRSWNDFSNAFKLAGEKYPVQQIKQHINTIIGEIEELSIKSVKSVQF